MTEIIITTVIALALPVTCAVKDIVRYFKTKEETL